MSISLRVILSSIVVATIPTLGFAQVNVTTAPLRAVTGTPTCAVRNLNGVNLAVLTTIYDASGTARCSSNVAIPAGALATPLQCVGVTGLSACVAQVDTTTHADNIAISYELQDASGGAIAAVSGTRVSTLKGANLYPFKATPYTPALIASSQPENIECAIFSAVSQTVGFYIRNSLGSTSTSSASLGPNQMAAFSIPADGTGSTAYSCQATGGSDNKALFVSEYLQPGGIAADSLAPVSNTP
jgi:hypothetical protein